MYSELINILEPIQLFNNNKISREHIGETVYQKNKKLTLTKAKVKIGTIFDITNDGVWVMIKQEYYKPNPFFRRKLK